MAMLVLLESLSPEQRAVLLRDEFDYRYDEIAPIVGKSEDNVRQLARRARKHVQEGRPRFTTSREQQEELTRKSSPPPRRATSPRLRRCWHTTWCSRAMVAARCRR